VERAKRKQQQQHQQQRRRRQGLTTWPNRFEFSFLVRTHVVVTSLHPAQICFKTHDDDYEEDDDPSDSSSSTSNCAGSSPCVVN
jgi:hypothetical protein